MIDLHEMFEKHDDEYLRFERMESPPHRRPDVCAFILLDRLVPGTRDMVCCAEHDEIWLEVEMEALAKVATEGDVIALARCGVRICSETDSLAMFV